MSFGEVAEEFVLNLFDFLQLMKFLNFLGAIIITSFQIQAQITYTLTPCGATGSSGPSQTQINTTYTNTSLQGMVVLSSSMQVFTLTTAGIYEITAVGAKGGNAATTTSGGAGARVIAQYTLPANSVFSVMVGQMGLNGNYGGYYTGGGGGGGSYVAINGSVAVVAGGGGGAGIGETGLNGFNGNSANASTPGAAANGTIGQTNGAAGTSGNGGTGGYWYAAGGGAGVNSNGTAGTTGNVGSGGTRFANGGTGGAPGTYNSSTGGAGGFGGGAGAMFGGGGGGGYSGGAGGTHGGSYNGSGGGGGGSYASSSNQTIVASFNTGQGYVVIRRMFGPTIAMTSSVTCYGASNGALSSTITGGTAPYTYTWLPSGGNGSVATGLAAGVYTLQVADALSQTAEATYTLTQPNQVTSTFNYTHASCFGYANGTASANVSGGTAPYSVTWTPSGTNSIALSGLAAGSYTALILDANNCFGSAVASITQPSSFAVTATASTNTLCTGGVVVLNGGGATSYAWSNGVINGQAFSPTTTITYTLTGTLNNCTNTAMTTVSVFPRPTVTVASGSVCAGLSYVINPSGANSYTVQGGSFTVTPSSTTSYTLLGMNSFGCLSSSINTVVVTVNPYPVVTISGTNTACSGNAIALNASGAATYTWINSSATGSTGMFSPTSATNYTVAGTSSAGCTALSAAFQVSVIPSPTLSVSGVTSICAGNALQLSAAGANTYTWNNGTNNANLLTFPLTNTTYTVFGTSVNGCLGSLNVPITVNALPTLVLSGNTVICQGGSSTFSANGASTYTWSTGANASSVTIAPLTTYTISVNGSSAAGCVQTAALVLTVNPLPVLTVSGQNPICSGGTQTLTAAGANSYTWSTGGQNASVIISPLIGAGVHTLFVTGTSAAGCVATTTAGIPVNPTPTVLINGSAVLCAGNIATLTAIGANSYVWSNNLTNVSINVSPATNTTYSLVGTTTAGCSSTAALNITVAPNPLLIVTSSGSICIGKTGTLSASGASTYTWVNNGSGATVSVSPTTSSVFTVIGQSSVGCSATGTINLFVVPSPTLSISGNTAVCESKTSTLAVAGASIYAWSNGGTVNVTSITPTANTVYSVTGTSSAGCTATAQYSVTLNPAPVITLTASQSTICIGGLANLSAAGASTYSWVNGPSAASIAVTPTATTVYTVNGTNALGCTAQASLTLNVTDCTDLNEKNNRTARLYPNPTSNMLYVQSAHPTVASVRVYSTSGQLLIEQAFKDQTELDLSALANGIYHVMVTEDNATQTFRVIKQ